MGIPLEERLDAISTDLFNVLQQQRLMNVLLSQRLLSFHLCVECIHHEAILIFLTDNLRMILNVHHTLLQIGDLDFPEPLTHISGSDVIFSWLIR